MLHPLLQKRGRASIDTGQLESFYSLLTGSSRDDKAAYVQVRKGVGSMIANLTSSLPQKSRAARDVRFAKWDIETADSLARIGDWDSAADSQLHAVWKLQNVASMLQKRKQAYGLDISGESGEMYHGSEGIANRENQKNIDDTAQPFEQHETDHNPANLTRDFLAEQDFPSLAAMKSKRVHWPPRLK